MQAVNVLLMLAWRNLWRNHRRTFIMLAAVAVGAWAMIFMTALTQGMVDEVIKDGITALPGHVQVHHPEFRDDPNIANRLPLDDSELAQRLAGTDVTAWATRINVPAFITSERESRGVTLLGIDPVRERPFTFINFDKLEGRFLDDGNDAGLVIGRELAETLDTDIGKRVVVMSQDPDNDIADRGFRVVGLFEANISMFEEKYVFAGKETIKRLLRVDDDVTELVVLGDDYRDITQVFETTTAVFRGMDLSVERWNELDPYLGTMLDVMDGFVLIWVVVIFLALSFGLVNTLVMAVFERIREIGLMLALGMRPSSILGQVMIESMLLLAFGLTIGNLLAWLTIKPLESGIDISIVAEGMEMWGASSILYPQLRLQDVVLANAVVLVLGFLASLSPAWRASRYEPVEAITKAD